MIKPTGLLGALTGVLVVASLAVPGNQRRPARVDHVVLIGIDGLGSDGFRSARAPAMHALIDSGAHTLAARAVMPTVSSPNWASMISGAGPEQHGVTSNDWEPSHHEIDPVATDGAGIFPTMFGVVRRQRPKAEIGIVHEWDGFARLVEPDAPTLMQHQADAESTVVAAAAFIRDRRPTLTAIHLDLVDHAGHEMGWLGPEYVAAVERADALVARIISAVDQAEIRPTTLLLISADHGGVAKGHGGLTKTEIEIPWIINGPGVKRSHVIAAPVSTVDTAPTILFALGIEAPSVWVGRPVLDAFDHH